MQKSLQRRHYGRPFYVYCKISLRSLEVLVLISCSLLLVVVAYKVISTRTSKVTFRLNYRSRLSSVLPETARVQSIKIGA